MAAPVTRIVYLNALKAGISRLRTKGGPDPETLYDLVNGYVTQAGTVESRPGTVSRPGGGVARDHQLQQVDSLRSLVSQDPKRVAQVVRNWIGENE